MARLDPYRSSVILRAKPAAKAASKNGRGARAGVAVPRRARLPLLFIFGTAFLVAIGGVLLSAPTYVFERPKPEKAMRVAVMDLRKAVELWRGTHAANECPSFQQLKDDGEIDSGAKGTDAWGTPFRITCLQDETIVKSFGPDKTGSDDDIVAPSQEAQQAMRMVGE